MNNRDIRRFNRLTGHPDFQRFCLAWANEAGVPVPSGVNPAIYVMSELYKTDPGLCTQVVNNCLAEHERFHGELPAAPDDAHDWDAELPAAAILKEWKAIDPKHSRLPQAATSPQWEAIARQDLARAGVAPFPGLTAGQTEMAVLHYMGKHSGALKGGDRAIYDSLARRMGGALGDGEAVRAAVEQVKQSNYSDHVLQRIAEKGRVAEAEAAKYRPKAPEQPTFDKKRIPQSALKSKEKPRDTTRDEVKHQYERLKRQWELPDKQQRSEPLRMRISNKLQLDAAMALCKAKGEPYSRVFASVDPAFRKELVGHLRENGYEPAAASRSSGNSSERHWVPARSNTGTGESYSSESYSGGTSPGSGSGDVTSEAPAAAGGGQP